MEKLQLQHPSPTYLMPTFPLQFSVDSSLSLSARCIGFASIRRQKSFNAIIWNSESISFVDLQVNMYLVDTGRDDVLCLP